jgi:lipopolysaccharide export system protein LptA
MRVEAARLDFNDQRHEATFLGNVRLLGPVGEVRADRAAAFLAPGKQEHADHSANRSPGTNLGGTLERMVMLGNVRITQPSRLGTGEQLTYAAATNNFVLTGTPATPPKVTGERGTVLTGATIVFGAEDSSIVVAGARSGAKGNGETRVHTETDLKQ